MAFIKFTIICEDRTGEEQNVVEFNTHSDIKLKLEITRDMVVKMDILKFKIEYLNLVESNIGTINEYNIRQLLSILSKLIYSILNTLFDSGYQIKTSTDIINYSL